MYKFFKQAIVILIAVFMIIPSIHVFAEAKDGSEIYDLPERYFNECPHPGAVIKETIPVETGWLTGEMTEDCVEVYLPCGYDSTEKYNFLLMLNQYGCEDNVIVGDKRVSLKNVYDWIIDEGKESFIAMIVQIPEKQDENQFRYLAYKIRNYYLPFIAKNYSVYARDTIESWMLERNHSGIFGSGSGAVFAFKSGLVWNVDLFGSYFFGNNSYAEQRDIPSIINSEKKYPVTFLGYGSKQNGAYNTIKSYYESIINNVEYLNDGENAKFFNLTDTTFADVAAVLPSFFPDTERVNTKADHTHMFRMGECMICGATPTFYKDDLPRRYHFECPEQGTIVSFTYETKDWHKENSETFEKTALVYLPYGYDESRRYNVMIMLHGHTLNRHAFMDTIWGFDYGVRVQYKNDYDWIMYEGLCRPTIIVTLDTPAEAMYKFKDMEYELRYDVLPYLANHFATYAKDGGEESLIKARDHFGLGGSSNGAGFTHGGALHSNIAYFGSVMMSSGGMNFTKHANSINEAKDEYKLNCFIRSCGTLDPLYEDVAYGYRYVANKVDYLEPGKNIFLFEITNGHNMRVGYTALADALQVLFPPMPDEVEPLAASVIYQVSRMLKEMQQAN